MSDLWDLPLGLRCYYVMIGLVFLYVYTCVLSLVWSFAPAVPPEFVQCPFLPHPVAATPRLARPHPLCV